ncbi:MAG: hypothetical protein J07HR59_01717 [Halorubrum sp. J07HR59]|nr:MAG: hypothetical protein J07HR59_01717 [Halorubrum sp. J07HR59]
MNVFTLGYLFSRMSDLPEDFDCTVTDWEYIYGLCRSVSEQVKAAQVRT